MHQQHQIDYRRVERGIAYIAAHFREGPALEDVAAAAHVSPFHFQRMFTAWAGVSPKTFARYLSLDHARHALRNGGASLLGATLDSFRPVRPRPAARPVCLGRGHDPGRLCALERPPRRRGIWQSPVKWVIKTPVWSRSSSG